MNKTDTFELKTVICDFGKPRVLRFTMRTMFELERIYGSMRAAFDCFFSTDAAISYLATEDFLCVLLGLNKETVEKCIDMVNLFEARQRIPEALEASFPALDDNEEFADRACNDGAGFDWDFLYYTARYRLLMNDDEFWDCTPRRFFKLNYLWCWDHGLVKKKPEIFMGEVRF